VNKIAQIIALVMEYARIGNVNVLKAGKDQNALIKNAKKNALIMGCVLMDYVIVNLVSKGNTVKKKAV